MELKRKNICPLLKKTCIGLDCMWFLKVTGTDPQDNTKVIEDWNCAINLQLIATLEVAKRAGNGADGVQKAVESFRNEMVKANHASLASFLTAGNQPAYRELPEFGEPDGK